MEDTMLWAKKVFGVYASSVDMFILSLFLTVNVLWLVTQAPA